MCLLDGRNVTNIVKLEYLVNDRNQGVAGQFIPEGGHEVVGETVGQRDQILMEQNFTENCHLCWVSEEYINRVYRNGASTEYQPHDFPVFKTVLPET